MVKILYKLKSNIFRNFNELPLENKLSNIFMFLGALICFSGFIINLFNNIPILLNGLIAICGTAYAIMFYLSSFKRITKPLELPFQIVTVFVILYNWFTIQGIEGSSSNFFYLGIFALIYSNSKKNYWTIFTYIIITSILLVLIQIFYPNLIIPYPDKETQLIDLWTGFFLAMISFGVLVIIVKNNFDKERVNNEEKNIELVTEKNKAEENEKNYRLIFNSSGTANSIFDSDCILRFQNNLSKELIGRGENGGIGLSVFELFGEKTGQEIFNRMKRVMKTGVSEVFETEFDLPSGKYWFRSTYQPFYNSDSKNHSIQIISHNITENKNAKNALQESEKRFRNLFKNSPIGIYQTSPDGVILAANPALVKMLGFDSFEECAKRNLEQTKSTSYSRKDFKDQLERDGFINGLESEWTKKDNTTFFVRENATVIRDKAGNVLYYDGTIEDITDKKLSELELVKAKEKAEESDRLKSAFLANMSHEIRTPMNGILGFADLLKDNNLSSEKQRYYIEIIEQSGQRMLSTINDIIDLSKIESGQTTVNYQEINLNNVLQELYLFFNNQYINKGLELKYQNEISESDSIIETDLTKFNQVLTNLLSNALKFTKSGSVIFGFNIINDIIEFYVKDTGIGISTENQKVIFERFRQGSESYARGYEGSGLGLSISKAFIELLGGKIWFNSELGKGTTFYFTLPNNVKKQDSNRHSASEFKSINLENKYILIVEDDHISSLFIKNKLMPTKINMLFAENGESALNILKNNSNIDLILMDMKMPVLDGYKTTIEIRKTNKSVPIIAQTAFAFAEDEKKALECGCNAYISKPIKIESLFQLLNMFLNK